MCTTFTLQNNESILLGQNYDFYYGHGLIVVSKRDLLKDSLREDGKKGVTWTSKYGSVTFTQFGRELPSSGMNERGLAIAMMYHEDGQYPEADNRPALNELQWIQYQLDQYASVEEVVNNLDHIRLEKSMYELHYTVSDASGHTVIIEFIAGKPQVIKDAQYFTVTNTSFDKSLQYANKFKGTSISKLSKRVNSLDRFTLAYRIVENKSLQYVSSQIPIKEAFTVLEEVSVKPSFGSIWRWVGHKIPPTFTYWSIVFDMKNLTIHYRDYRNKAIRSIELKNFNFSKVEPVLSLQLDNQLRGGIESDFKPYTAQDNERIIRISYKPITDIFPIEDQLELAKYPDTFK
ncbi:linear amide C-N hydrolase [Cohnella boryungensis]|uniref:Linear amide C-N hydrolase n=2 Tax=Bacteria TaxID=2 RepID=A0ABV8S9W8_9BACL